jgi:hypothetical protein
MGENTLRLWGSQRDITVNKAEEDKAGWDFLLEFPLTDSELPIALPLDKAPYPLRCFVQVKSSDNRSGKWQVKLDNWVRLIRNPLPTFFLVLEFDEQDSCQQAYLVHVDEHYIAAVLKRLRELPKSEADSLHKKSIQFTYGDEHRLKTLDGSGLIDAIKKNVRINPEDYATKKAEINARLGYEEGSTKFNFKFRLPAGVTDPQEYFVDFLLGLVPSLDVVRGEARDVRFGISYPSSMFPDISEGSIQVEPKPISPGTIRIKTSDHSRELQIAADVYAPPLDIIDEKYLKVRFAVPFFNLFYWPNQAERSSFSYDFPDVQTTYRLSELSSFAELLLLFDEVSSQEGLLFLELLLTSKRLGSGQLAPKITMSDASRQVLNAIHHASMIAKYFDLPPQSEVRIIDLLRQTDPLTFMANVVRREKTWFRIVFWSSGKMPKDGKPYCIPITGSSRIGAHMLIVGATVNGTVEATGRTEGASSEYQLTTTDIDILRRYIFHQEDAVTVSPETIKQDVIDEIGDRAHVIYVDNL